MRDFIFLISLVTAAIVGGIAAELKNYIRYSAHEERLAVLESRVVGRGPGGWHRKHMIEWCGQLEENNDSIECPNPAKILLSEKP